MTCSKSHSQLVALDPCLLTLNPWLILLQHRVLCRVCVCVKCGAGDENRSFANAALPVHWESCTRQVEKSLQGTKGSGSICCFCRRPSHSLLRVFPAWHSADCSHRWHYRPIFLLQDATAYLILCFQHNRIGAVFSEGLLLTTLLTRLPHWPWRCSLNNTVNSEFCGTQSPFVLFIRVSVCPAQAGNIGVP